MHRRWRAGLVAIAVIGARSSCRPTTGGSSASPLLAGRCSALASRSSPSRPRCSTPTADSRPDLPREAFELYDDGERQPITQFTRERVPVGLGLLLDISDSMYGRRVSDARAAVSRFLFELLDPADEFFVYAFNHAPQLVSAWTRDAGLVAHAHGGAAAERRHGGLRRGARRRCRCSGPAPSRAPRWS